MNILVTGSKGFIGGHIIKHFKKNYKLLTPSRNELDLTDLNQVTDYFNNNKIDHVIHCAVSGRELPESIDPQYFVDNVLMFRNIWINKNKFDKLINLASMYECDQYDDNTDITELEFLDHLPTTSYSLSKNIISRIIKETNNFYNLTLFGIFHETEIKKRFFKKVIYEQEITLIEDRYIDFMYLNDIFPMLDIILNDKSNHKFIDMVYEEKFKLSELAHMMCDHIGLDKNKIKIINPNGKNFTSKSKILKQYNLNLIGIRKGIQQYFL